LFRGREGVYALRWIGKDGIRAGYSPACANEWKTGICNKGKVKCETCYFLAVDFDVEHWQKDVTAYAASCDDLEVPVAI
jgi:hypothetical protein